MTGDHAGNMARDLAASKPMSRCQDFKLTHYPLSSALLLTAGVCWAQQWGRFPSQQAQIHTEPELVWKRSLAVRRADPGITAIGGTELRASGGL